MLLTSFKAAGRAISSTPRPLCQRGRRHRHRPPCRRLHRPELDTVTRPGLVVAAREAADADYDVLVACASSYVAHASEFSKLGRIPVLKARTNADLRIAGDLKNTCEGNLFVIFGEPDIEIIPVQENGDKADQIQVKVNVNGVDVFHRNTGENFRV